MSRLRTKKYVVSPVGIAVLYRRVNRGFATFDSIEAGNYWSQKITSPPIAFIPSRSIPFSMSALALKR